MRREFIGHLRRSKVWTAAVNIIVLVTGMVVVWWLPYGHRFPAAGIFLFLVLGPGLLLDAARRQSVRGRTEAAVIYQRLACLLRPTAGLRFDTAVSAAVAKGPIELKVVALRALARRATPQQQVVLDTHIAVVRGDWNAVLDYIHRADGGLRPKLRHWEIRALGEIGQLNDMAHALPSQKVGLPGTSNYFCYLFVLAFSGRFDSVRLLLERKPLLHSKDYWMAIAAKASGSDEDEWRGVMTTFASTTKNESFRRAADRHLVQIPDPIGPVLSTESAAMIDVIEERLREHLLRIARPKAPVTVILIALVILGFVTELLSGGSSSPGTLIELGAISASQVVDGEWWRLVTSWFLHDGPFHFAITLYLLLLCGTMCEIKVGSLRMFLIYCVGGLASSTTALSLMWSGADKGAYFVGSTGGLMAFLGCEIGGLLRDRSYWRMPLGRRRPMSILRYLYVQTAIILSLWVDVAFEFHLLHSFIVHVPSFVAGLLINLIFGDGRPEPGPVGWVRGATR